MKLVILQHSALIDLAKNLKIELRATLAVPRQVLTMKTNKLIFQQSIAAFLFSGAAAVLFLLLMNVSQQGVMGV